MKISDKFHLENIYKLKNTVLTGKTEDIKWINKVVRRFSAKDYENHSDLATKIFRNKKKYNRKEKYKKDLWR